MKTSRSLTGSTHAHTLLCFLVCSCGRCLPRLSSRLSTVALGNLSSRSALCVSSLTLFFTNQHFRLDGLDQAFFFWVAISSLSSTSVHTRRKKQPLLSRIRNPEDKIASLIQGCMIVEIHEQTSILVKANSCTIT